MVIITIIFFIVGSSIIPIISANIKKLESKQEMTNLGWYYLTAYPNYAPNGLPDISQKQHKWRYIIDGGNGIAESNAEGDDVQITQYGEEIKDGDPVITMGKNCYLDSTPGGDDVEFWNFCFLVSLSNCFWWLDSKYSDSNGTPGDGLDSYPLVEDYGVGDDHSPENAPLLVCDLAHLQGIPCYNKSFSAEELYKNLEEWMFKKGLGNTYGFTDYINPTFSYIAEEIMQEKPVILYIAFYHEVDNKYVFSGNHFVSCTGVNVEEKKIAFCDPFLDINNQNESNHNDAFNVSYDIYQVELGSPFSNFIQYPAIKCWLPDYWPYYDLCTIDQATVIHQINNTLNHPSISGRRIGRTGISYNYTFTSTVPNATNISYYIDWGDNNICGWTNYQSSNNPLIISHTWEKPSIYTIKAKIKDENGKQSTWGDLQLLNLREKSVSSFFFKQLIQKFPIFQFLIQIFKSKLNYGNEYKSHSLIGTFVNPNKRNLLFFWEGN